MPSRVCPAFRVDDACNIRPFSPQLSVARVSIRLHDCSATAEKLMNFVHRSGLAGNIRDDGWQIATKGTIIAVNCDKVACDSLPLARSEHRNGSFIHEEARTVMKQFAH